MFIIREKDNIKIVLKISSKENQNFEGLKTRIKNITDEFNISLSISQEVDLSVPKNEIKIEYYTRASVNERIGDNYLKFLDKFLDLGAEKNIKTYPMD